MAYEKIAVISDLHGNYEASKTVFSDIKKRNCTKIFCLGDIISKGHHPNECIEMVKNNCDVVVQGNCDFLFTKKTYSLEDSELQIMRHKWNRNIVSLENQEYLRNLPFCYEFYLSGSFVRIFHGTPFKLNEVIINFDSVKRKSTIFEPSENTLSDKVADIVLYGHIHHQYLDKIYNKTLINVGSVGNSFDAIRKDDFDSDIRETTQAHYVIIEGNLDSLEYEELNIQFIRIPYDIEKELEDINQNCERDAYIYELKNGLYRNMEIIKKQNKHLGIEER